MLISLMIAYDTQFAACTICFSLLSD